MFPQQTGINVTRILTANDCKSGSDPYSKLKEEKCTKITKSNMQYVKTVIWENYMIEEPKLLLFVLSHDDVLDAL